MLSTGRGGHSLKCRHALPSNNAEAAVPVPTSELRFNLPSLTPPPAIARTPAAQTRSSVQERRTDTSKADSEDKIEDAPALDLSLGQEHAGGGLGGKRAKLGKLIIEDEGQKMLDLVVAANIGLWWRAYEKAFGAW